MNITSFISTGMTNKQTNKKNAVDAKLFPGWLLFFSILLYKKLGFLSVKVLHHRVFAHIIHITTNTHG